MRSRCRAVARDCSAASHNRLALFRAPQLALRLQLLEARGELSGALPADTPSGALPAFKDWRFSRGAYVQYVVDIAAVHAALEAAAAAATAASPPAPAAPLLAWLAPAGGLARAAAAAADVAALCGGEAPPPPSAAAEAHAARIAALGVAACASPSSSSSAESVRSAGARVACHGYALHVSHVSLGMRLGAKAAQQLDLARAGALSLYSHYPLLPRASPAAAAGASSGVTPLAVLARGVDALGVALGQGDGADEPREALFEELPRAVRAATALWAGLATAGGGEEGA
jgi:hypothetical protein